MKKIINKLTPAVPKRILFFVAALLWLIASSRVLMIGLDEISSNTNKPLIYFFIGFVGFIFFFRGVFYKLFIKHTKRIVNKAKEKLCIFSFFDVKSYLIMIFMISFGISLKFIKAIPKLYLGTFYIALGLSLLAAAISFLYGGIRYAYMENKHKIKKFR